MNKKIAWITDSTSSLDGNFIKQNNVFVVPLGIIFGNESFKENVDITTDEFYAKLKTAKELPKTSQPVIGEFLELYENLKKDFDCAIAIHCSGKLSGTVFSSQSAAEMANFDVTVIDSKIGSYPLSKIIERGVELYNNGQDVETIVKSLKDMTNKTHLYFTPANMEQLHRSGRVSGSQAFLGNLLKIKLILGFDDASVVIKEKVRSEKKAKQAISNLLSAEIVHNSIKEVAVIHTNNPYEAEIWKNELTIQYPEISFLIMPLIPVVAVHTGEGTLGLSWINN